MTDLFFKQTIKVKDLKNNGYTIKNVNNSWWIVNSSVPNSAAMIKYYEGGDVEPSDDFVVESVCGVRCADIVDDIAQKLNVDYMDDEEYFYGEEKDED